MDPIAQILAQQSSGTANGQGFGEDYAKGRDFSLRERYLKIQQAQEQRAQSRFNVMEPLEEQEARDRAAISGANRVVQVQQLGAVAKSNMAIPEIIQLQIDAARLPGGVSNPEWRKRVEDFTSTHPIEMSVGDGLKVVQMYQSEPIYRRKQAVTEMASRYPNIDISTPAGMARASRNDSVKELYKRAKDEGKLLNQLPDDWFYEDGTINEQKAVPGLGALPRSEMLQSREDIAQLRDEFRRQFGENYNPGDMQKKLDTIDRAVQQGHLTPERADRARDMVFGLEAHESAAAHWFERAEVQPLARAKEAAIQNKLNAEIERDTKARTTDEKDAAQRTVEAWNKRIKVLDKQIDRYRPSNAVDATPPAKAGKATPAPAATPTNPTVDALAPSTVAPTTSRIRTYNEKTGRLE